MKEIDEYIEACILHRKHIDDGEHKKANKYYDKAEKIVEKFINNEQTDILYPLLEHENPSVRLKTSRYLYSKFPVEATDCLLNLISEVPSHSYIAELTLEGLQNGDNEK